jgi:hypothetical protein
MRGVQIAAVAMALGVCALNHAALSANAETTYTVVPGQCGGALNLMQCAIALYPANRLGIYPTLQMTDNLIDNTGGLVDWSTTHGPTGHYLGAGLIQTDETDGRYRSYPTLSHVCSNGACSEQVTALTVYFHGAYIGGGIYTGLYTLHMSYKYEDLRGARRWIRTIIGGVITLTR